MKLAVYSNCLPRDSTIYFTTGDPVNQKNVAFLRQREHAGEYDHLRRGKKVLRPQYCLYRK